MDKRIENIGVAGQRKLPSGGEDILKLEVAGGRKGVEGGAWHDFDEMIKNMNLDKHYPKPESGIPLRNELSKEKAGKITELLKYIGKLADETAKRLGKQG